MPFPKNRPNGIFPDGVHSVQAAIAYCMLMQLKSKLLKDESFCAKYIALDIAPIDWWKQQNDKNIGIFKIDKIRWGSHDTEREIHSDALEVFSLNWITGAQW